MRALPEGLGTEVNRRLKSDQYGYQRLPLRLPFQFTRAGLSVAIESITQEISSDALAFDAPQELPIGERLHLDLLLPAVDCVHDGLKIHLQCYACVVRAEAALIGRGFRVRCQIEGNTIRFENLDLKPHASAA